VYAQLDLKPVGGEGPWLIMADGRRILDMYGGHAVAALGYGHPALVAALQDQVQRLTFQSNLLPLELRARACEALARFAPPGLDRVFLVNSGAEANENALKLAFGGNRAHPHRRRRGRIPRPHGGGRRGDLGQREVVRLPAQALRGQLRVAARSGRARAQGRRRHRGADRRAGAGHGRRRRHAAGVPRSGAPATREAGALLIFDEVQCGMGRTGRPFAADYYGVTPDIITTAKGLAGGFPAGAVITTSEIAGRLKLGELGTTFGGGPMACAAIETVLAVIRDEGLLERVRTLSEQIRETCQVGPVTAIQGAGFLLGLVCSRPAQARSRPSCSKHDILAGTSADPRVLRLLPPFILEPEHVARLAAALAEIAP
jgi:acetylornithine/N-succinyldiaminopimelate aminotransferase